MAKSVTRAAQNARGLEISLVHRQWFLTVQNFVYIKSSCLYEVFPQGCYGSIL